MPTFAEDAGENPKSGRILADPMRNLSGWFHVAMIIDHQFERRNYLNLAGSKLRPCSLGPELIVGDEFQSVAGTVAIERGGALVWSHAIKTGDAEMCHSLRNLEHHHFKFEGHRRPGDLHIHFFGADAFSFGAGLRLMDGDVMKVSFEGFGRALLNPVRIDPAAYKIVVVTPLL